MAIPLPEFYMTYFVAQNLAKIYTFSVGPAYYIEWDKRVRS
jgi:hypothetical protein